MEYAVFKLMNGDEIIAKVMEEDKHSVTLFNPVLISRVITPVGHEMMRCSHWMLFNENPSVVVERHNILTYAKDVSSNAIKHYDFFLKHADHNEVDHDMGEMVEAAEQEYRRRMKKYDKIETEVDDIEDVLIAPANTTIH